MLSARAHRRLLADIDRWAARAGVSAEDLDTGLEWYCGAREIGWAERYLRSVCSDGRAAELGLLYEGVEDATRRMRGLAAAAVRNHVDARLLSPEAAAHEGDDCTMLLVLPIGDPPAWLAGKLAGVLMAREASARVSVAAVRSLRAVRHAELAAALGALARLRPADL